MNRRSFFSLSLTQTVNQWLCMLLLALFCFLVVLYYFVEKAKIVGDYYVSATFRVESLGSN